MPSASAILSSLLREGARFPRSISDKYSEDKEHFMASCTWLKFLSLRYFFIFNLIISIVLFAII